MPTAKGPLKANVAPGDFGVPDLGFSEEYF